MEDELRQLALNQGFHDVGFCVAEPYPEMEHLSQWLEMGCHADMEYVKRHKGQRMNPLAFVKSARSIIMVVQAYRTEEMNAPAKDDDKPGLRIARFACSTDYHETMKKKLYPMVRYLKERRFKARSFVDTAPAMEKLLGARAGLGRLGRNSLLIHPRYGSWVMLGGIATSAELTPSKNFHKSPPECRACGACIAACPQGAIHPSGYVDGRRCLSYWTLETDSTIAAEVTGNAKGYVAGCDVCQEVCPENAEASFVEQSAVLRPIPHHWNAARLRGLSKEEWEGIFAHSPAARMGFSRFTQIAREVEGWDGSISE